VHAAPASGRGGCSLDIGPIRWRGEGGDQESKRELAYRLAVCWNLVEGWPTEALERGVLGAVEDALVQLLELIDERSQHVPDDIRMLGDRLSRLLDERDTHYDLTDGRPHDCVVCLAKPALPCGRNGSAIQRQALAVMCRRRAAQPPQQKGL
jgi:hypothetical protein